MSVAKGPAILRRPGRYILVLIAVGLAVYANSLQGGHFILDDESSIVNNFDIRQIWPLWRDADRTTNPPVNNRPVVRLSLALNYALGELDVRGYRLFNLVVHICCAVALFAVMRVALRSWRLADRYGEVADGLACAVALIWLVHPLQTQVVNHTIQRSTSLMALCYLATLYCGQRTFATGAVRWGAGAVVSCALGMGSKEAMVMAPVVVLLYDRIFAAGSFLRAIALRRGFYAGLAATWGILLFLLRDNPHGDSIDLNPSITAGHYAFNQTRVIIEHYIAKIFWPDPLTNFYGPIRYLQIVEIWPFALAMVTIVGLTGYALLRWPAAGFCGAWFFLLLAPTSSVVAIFWEAMAERRPYLALAGLLALVVVGAYRGLVTLGAGRGWSILRCELLHAVMLWLVVIALGWTTVARNETYKDLGCLWQSEVVYVEEVVAGLDDILPKVLYHYAEAYIKLGRVYTGRGQWAQALAAYERALEIYPQSFKAYKWLGHMFLERNMPQLAIDHFRRAVKLNPMAYNAHNALGALLCKQGAVEEGEAHLRKALEIHPNYVWAYSNLGAALMMRGWDDAARAMFERALGIAPDFAPALANIADLGD